MSRPRYVHDPPCAFPQALGAVFVFSQTHEYQLDQPLYDLIDSSGCASISWYFRSPQYERGKYRMCPAEPILGIRTNQVLD